MAHEVIVVAASLDAIVGPRIPDHLRSSGEQAAAVLEAARHLSALAQFHHIPRVSLMFVFHTGSVDRQAGLRAFSESLPWNRENIRKVVYLPASHQDESVLRSIFNERALQVEFIDLNDSGETSVFRAAARTHALLEHLLADSAVDPERTVPLRRETVTGPSNGPTSHHSPGRSRQQRHLKLSGS
jgi:hypothetical protein